MDRVGRLVLLGDLVTFRGFQPADIVLALSRTRVGHGLFFS